VYRTLSLMNSDVVVACSCGILRQTVTPDLRYVILSCAAQFFIRQLVRHRSSFC
ncbi:hypothetical protein MKX03_010286, partial [Papaver bracteatum]